MVNGHRGNPTRSDREQYWVDADPNLRALDK